jgi:hypothetical protein
LLIFRQLLTPNALITLRNQLAAAAATYITFRLFDFDNAVAALGFFIVTIV